MQSPYFRRLVSPAGYRYADAPIIGLGESAEETIARLDRENAIAQAQQDVENAVAPSDAELSQRQAQEASAMRKMEKELKAAMLNNVAQQLAFEVAINSVPGVGAVLSLVLGQLTKKSGEKYKEKAEDYVKKTQVEIDDYKKKRSDAVLATLSDVYDQEYRSAEAATIALITEKVMAVQVDGLNGFGSFIKKAINSIKKTIQNPTRLITKPIEQIKDFVDDMTGKSSYDATVKSADEQKEKSFAEIKLITNAQMAEARSEHGRALMRSTIVSTLLQSPQFKRLAELMLETRRAKATAAKNQSLGKKLAIGVGVATLAVVAAKVL